MHYLGLIGLLSFTAGSLAAPPAAGAAMTADAGEVFRVADATAPAAAEAQIARGLTEALRLATDTVVARLGQPGGFAADPAIRIPLPGGLESVRDGLLSAGLGPLVEDLERRMNRAAERAVPEAQSVFRDALAAMTIEDARTVLNGPDDSATRYFAERMGPELAERMTPIVDAELRDVGAVRAFEAFAAEYAALPLMPDIRGSLTGHVVDGTLAGFFHHMAAEERRIRNDPAARTTALLRSVFGS